MLSEKNKLTQTSFAYSLLIGFSKVEFMGKANALLVTRIALGIMTYVHLF